MDLDVQWCAYNSVEQNILTPDLCKQIKQMFEGKCDLQTFAQTILDNGLCADIELVQKIMNDSFGNAKNGDAPPVNYFEEDRPTASSAPAATAPPQASTSPATAAPSPVKSSVAPGAVPGISDVESLSDDDKRQRMIDLLMAMRSLVASDFHLSAAYQPFARINRSLQVFGNDVLTAKASEALNTILLTAEQKEAFLKTGDLDYCLALDKSNRFRVNLMNHKDGIAGTYRLIPNAISSLEKLGFNKPEAICKLLDYHNGLILVTGPVGSGKTTTLAALVEVMNDRRYDHIITVEDPIEIIQMSNHCNVTQRQVGRDTKSFAAALKGALRQDPDIIVIGELRDLETIEMAITASETGHLVIGTFPTSDAGSTLNRLLDVFPPAQQQQIRAMVAESLKGIICQQLLPKVGGGMVVSTEILLGSTAVANSIRDNKTHQLKQVLETGMKQGMHLMDQSTFQLFAKGVISEETALAYISDKGILNKVSNKPAADAAAAAAAAEPAPKKKRFGFR